MSKPTESKLQRAMFAPLADRGYSHITPNVHLFGWESDLVGLTGSGYVVEYEIKISRSDYRRDQEKKRHRMLLSHTSTAGANMRTAKFPCRFFYACPPGLIAEDTLPRYAGLVYVTPSGIDRQTNAPRLTKTKARKSQRTTLAKSLMWDAWTKRPVSKR
jgi:hypothetical protein